MVYFGITLTNTAGYIKKLFWNQQFQFVLKLRRNGWSNENQTISIPSKVFPNFGYSSVGIGWKTITQSKKCIRSLLLHTIVRFIGSIFAVWSRYRHRVRSWLLCIFNRIGVYICDLITDPPDGPHFNIYWELRSIYCTK